MLPPETLVPHAATMLVFFGQAATVLAVGLAASVAGLLAGTACAAIGAPRTTRYTNSVNDQGTNESTT